MVLQRQVGQLHSPLYGRRVTPASAAAVGVAAKFARGIHSSPPRSGMAAEGSRVDRMRWIWTIAALTCAGSASAGPLGWDYSIRSVGDSGHARVYAGHIEWTDIDPTGPTPYHAEADIS